ncbi:hypothetical protein [Nonomuraea dietziae]|uniref:hypothetical protein n=1 Tax=Nonomuraea dietziae TaxID=65515 RepID=UPI0031D91E67
MTRAASTPACTRLGDHEVVERDGRLAVLVPVEEHWVLRLTYDWNHSPGQSNQGAIRSWPRTLSAQ